MPGPIFAETGPVFGAIEDLAVSDFVVVRPGQELVLERMGGQTINRIGVDVIVPVIVATSHSWEDEI